MTDKSRLQTINSLAWWNGIFFSKTFKTFKKKVGGTDIQGEDPSTSETLNDKKMKFLLQGEILVFSSMKSYSFPQEGRHFL